MLFHLNPIKLTEPLFRFLVHRSPPEIAQIRGAVHCARLNFNPKLRLNDRPRTGSPGCNLLLKRGKDFAGAYVRALSLWKFGLRRVVPILEPSVSIEILLSMMTTMYALPNATGEEGPVS